MIPPESQSEEKKVLAAVDAAFTEARARAGKWLVCRPGCDECCRKPFAITAADSRRLQAGLATLPAALQDDIRERARAARAKMAEDFPGELSSGALTEEPEWREWFFARHTGLPCPVLDITTGQCQMYSHRPVACRLAGPLIQIGTTETDPCPLCFEGVTTASIKATIVVVNESYFYSKNDEAETVIPFALMNAATAAFGSELLPAAVTASLDWE
jgi:Fe-S-cluster containining protein